MKNPYYTEQAIQLISIIEWTIRNCDKGKLETLMNSKKLKNLIQTEQWVKILDAMVPHYGMMPMLKALGLDNYQYAFSNRLAKYMIKRGNI